MDEKLLGKCGFYCGCCPTCIKGGCKGCVDEHQTGDCYTRDCVLKQGIDCCGACAQFPCDTIMTRPHTTVLDRDWLRWKRAIPTDKEKTMIRPILACKDPYKTAQEFAAAGWNIDFSQPPESGDPLAGVSLCGNSVLLGVTDGYVADDQLPYIGCGVEIYMTVPAEQIRQIYEDHRMLNPTRLEVQPWGDLAFEVKIGAYQFMIASQEEKQDGDRSDVSAKWTI